MRSRAWAVLALVASLFALPPVAEAAEPTGTAWYVTQTGERQSVRSYGTRTFHTDSSQSTQLTVTGSPESGTIGVRVSHSLQTDIAFTFAARPGQTVATGAYTDTRAAADADHPGLLVDEGLPNPGCPDPVGRWTVHEINADLSRLWITYEYRCRSGMSPAPVWGEIQVGRPTPTGVLVTADRSVWPAAYPGVQSVDTQITLANVGYPSGLDVTAATITGSPDFRIRYNTCLASARYRFDPACEITVVFIPSGVGPRTATLKITHEAGTDSVALSGSGIAEHSSFGLYDKQGRFGPAGEQTTFLPGGAVFSMRGSPSDLVARVDRFRHEETSTQSYEIRLTDPSGAALKPDDYSDNDSSGLTSPQLGVTVNGQKCPFEVGNFKIYEVEFFDDGEPRALQATFDLRCGPQDKGVFGAISYRAAELPPPIPQAPPGPLRDAVAKGGLNQVVLSWSPPSTVGNGPYGGVEVYRSDDAEKPVSEPTGKPIRTGLLSSITVKGPFAKTGTAFTIFPRNGFNLYGPATVLRVYNTAFAEQKVSAATVAAGSTSTLSGQLRGNRNHTDALAKRKLTIERRLAGTSTWSVVGSVTTDSAGRYKASVKPPGTADYRLVYPGTTDTVGVVGATQRVTVRPKVTLSANRSSGALGTTFTFTTKLTPAQNDVELSLQRYSGGKWTTVAKKKTSNGSATFTHKPTTRGTHTYRVSKPVSTASTSNTSSSVKVKTT